MFACTHSPTQNTLPKSLPQTPSPTPFFSVETPPSESLRGTISSRSGTLFWESRVATEPAKLTDSAPIEQGERLISKEKSNAVVVFNTVGTMKLSENTDVSFIQTLPIDFVVEQKEGIIQYEMNGTVPLSIRMRNALITKTSGTIQIEMKSGDSVIRVSTLKGTAQIGFNDSDYVSQVFTLREGQVYDYDSSERTTVNEKNK